MAILPKNDRRRGNRIRDHHRKSNLEPIKIGGDVDKGQEVTVQYGTAPKRKEKSIFGWFEEFTMEWSETFIPKKQKTTRGENE